MNIFLKKIGALCATLCLAVSLQAQGGIQFFEGTWEGAVAKAKKERKIIFMDAYATWCGPCKYLKQKVFVNGDVGAFYNKNFVNFAIDWESAAAAPLRNKYPLRAYPTLFLIDPATEQAVTKVEGALDAANLIKFGEHGVDIAAGKQPQK
ncbi:hypothetical protein AGMMS4956_16940 [Bacteroidia bacterium]|nr:hypothetical protein AGMMS4956_16940 [Bacteroidia bacterium]